MPKKESVTEVPAQNASSAPDPKKTSCWKIGCIVLGVIAALVVVIIILATMLTSPIRKVARNQLDALKAGDITSAYALTSGQFKTQTSLEQFQAFVNQYPSLKNNVSSSFNNSTIENNTGTLEGKLTAADGTVTLITYKLVKENDQWKILGMEIAPSGGATSNTGTQQNSQTQSQTQSATTGATKILGIKISDTVGSKGIVEVAKTTFSPSTAEINVSVYIENGKKGTKVAALLTHNDSGAKVGPAYNDIEQDGTAISNFTFSKPTAGWPVGTYQIDTEMSTGETAAIEFTVK